jgi:hypothetical protein
MKRSKEGANGTLVGAKSSAEHAVDVVTNPVDETELKSLSLINLINLANEGISNNVILQVLQKLRDPTGSLSGKDNMVALRVFVGEKSPVRTIGTADLLQYSLQIVLFDESNLVVSRASSATGSKAAEVYGSAVSGLSADLRALYTYYVRNGSKFDGTILDVLQMRQGHESQSQRHP